ncbi:YlxR family protein [Saccharopolyspora gloriosae]|uniref:YlxR family protein n=1 Tax=Saccharopolyspora gloriosae TaxID=455344 RepID=UPI001616066E|nr:YlxR family protein [Saccharopolyspora gloriosae]
MTPVAAGRRPAATAVTDSDTSRGGNGLESLVARREGARIRTRSPGTHGFDRADGPVRTCVGCRLRTSAAELLRVVAEDGSAGSAAVPDPRSRRPGRGAWLHPDPRCLRLAERRRAFPRALRVPGPLDLSAVQAHLDSDPDSGTPSASGSSPDRRGNLPCGSS